MGGREGGREREEREATARALMVEAVLKRREELGRGVVKRDPDFELSNTDFLTQYPDPLRGQLGKWFTHVSLLLYFSTCHLFVLPSHSLFPRHHSEFFLFLLLKNKLFLIFYRPFLFFFL